MKIYDVIIVGGGPAGLFAALNITHNKSVLLIEKNDFPGKKLLIAGSGRCNITHSGDINDFFSHYGDNSKFLKSAFKNFTNVDLIDFFKARGLDIITDKNGKVFPATERSQDILNILIRECTKNNVEFAVNRNAVKISHISGLFHIESRSAKYTSHALIIATGGKSYPSTGSTGDGYSFAVNLGHTVSDIAPSLTPVYIRNYEFAELSGVSLRNALVAVYRNDKKIRTHKGDFGFTHVGLSGPGIIDFSRYMRINDTLKIGFCGVSPDEFRNSFIDAAAENGKLTIRNFLKKYDITESLIKFILGKIGIDHNKNMADIDKKARNQITELFCEYPFAIEHIGDFNVAMATAGGVSLSEINSGTMESKLIKNLYFAGEVLDIDGDTGGYNIQAAFSTGYLAAKNI